MILPTASVAQEGGPALWLAGLALLAYAMAALPLPSVERASALALPVGWLAHLGALAMEAVSASGARFGFAPVLSITVWLVIAVHALESRLLPLPTVRRWLAPAGGAAVLLALLYPGEMKSVVSGWVPLHFVLGVASYGLFGAAVLHAALLDASERRMRLRTAPRATMAGMPLLRLERLTFRFVEAGFVVLGVTLVLGAVSALQWRWDHKTVLSLLGWLVFAGLLAGRHLRGWRGRRATRWLYAGALLLLLAYAGSRFVLEVVLRRGGGA